MTECKWQRRRKQERDVRDTYDTGHTKQRGVFLSAQERRPDGSGASSDVVLQVIGPQAYSENSAEKTKEHVQSTVGDIPSINRA